MCQMNSHGIGAVVENVRDLSQGRAKVTVRAVVEEMGTASHAGLLVLPALIAATPLSGIPGLTSVCGIIITLISAQMIIAREHLWLPGWILRRRVDAEDLRAALDKAQPVVGFLDRHSRARLRWFTSRPGLFVVKVLCLVCAAAMPFLEIIPFTGSIAGFVILFLGLSMMTNDGLFAALGIGFLASGAVVVTILI